MVMSFKYDGTRDCLTCGKEFPKGEKRYGFVPYKGHYCEEHDGVDR